MTDGHPLLWLAVVAIAAVIGFGAGVLVGLDLARDECRKVWR